MADAKKKHALPVVDALKAKTFLERAEIGDEAVTGDRPPAAWIGLGAMSIFAFMVPLAMAAMSLLRSMYEHAQGRPNPVPLYALSVLVPAIASFGGGYLVGRFGPKMGAKGAALAGLVAGLGLFVITAMGEVRAGRGWVSGLSALAIVLVTSPSAWAGGRAGKAGRKGV